MTGFLALRSAFLRTVWCTAVMYFILWHTKMRTLHCHCASYIAVDWVIVFVEGETTTLHYEMWLLHFHMKEVWWAVMMYVKCHDVCKVSCHFPLGTLRCEVPDSGWRGWAIDTKLQGTLEWISFSLCVCVCACVCVKLVGTNYSYITAAVLLPGFNLEQVEDYVCTPGKCHRRPPSPQSSCRCQATKHRSSQPFHSVVPRVTLMQHLHHLLLPLFRNYHPKSMEHTTILNWQLFSEFQVGCNRLVRGRTSV